MYTKVLWYYYIIVLLYYVLLRYPTYKAWVGFNQIEQFLLGLLVKEIALSLSLQLRLVIG